MLKPTDSLVNNGWYFEVPGLISPHFSSLEGVSRKTGQVVVVDGTTNIKHKFSDQMKDFSDITLIRAKDASVDDKSIRVLADKCINEGFRFDGQLVKLHNKKEIFRIIFLGMRIMEEEHPSLKTDGTDKYDMKYPCSVSEWVEVD